MVLYYPQHCHLYALQECDSCLPSWGAQRHHGITLEPFGDTVTSQL